MVVCGSLADMVEVADTVVDSGAFFFPKRLLNILYSYSSSGSRGLYLTGDGDGQFLCRATSE